MFQLEKIKQLETSLYFIGKPRRIPTGMLLENWNIQKTKFYAFTIESFRGQREAVCLRLKDVEVCLVTGKLKYFDESADEVERGVYVQKLLLLGLYLLSGEVEGR